MEVNSVLVVHSGPVEDPQERDDITGPAQPGGHHPVFARALGPQDGAVHALEAEDI